MPTQFDFGSQVFALVELVVQSVIAVVSALLGLRVGLRQTRVSKRLEFVERQAQELYSPMLGCLKRIRASSSFREELSGAASRAWQDHCEEAGASWRSDATAHEEAFRPFAGLIDRHNRELRATLVPLYQRMRSLLTDNYWLAEESTRAHYAELCRYVEIWEVALAGDAPPAALALVDHSEARLQPLYDDLDLVMARLRGEIAAERTRGSPWPWRILRSLMPRRAGQAVGEG